MIMMRVMMGQSFHAWRWMFVRVVYRGEGQGIGVLYREVVCSRRVVP
jgi:hypothetical protein